MSETKLHNVNRRAKEVPKLHSPCKKWVDTTVDRALARHSLALAYTRESSVYMLVAALYVALRFVTIPMSQVCPCPHHVGVHTLCGRNLFSAEIQEIYTGILFQYTGTLEETINFVWPST